MQTTCPRCGSPRIENQRFCPSCGLDYSEATQATGQPTASTPVAPEEEESSRLPLIVGIFVILALLGVGGWFYLNNVAGDGEAGDLASESAEPTSEPTPELTPEPTPEATETPVGGTGEITFGIGLTDGLEVEQEQSTFAIGELGSFSASFVEPAGATSLDLIVSSRDAAGTETVVYTEVVPISDPAFDLFGIEDFDFSALVENVPGDYVMRYYRETLELAEGTFTISE